MFTVTVTAESGNAFGTITYGILTYVRNVLEKVTNMYSQELIDTVRSIYMYNKATESYIAAK